MKCIVCKTPTENPVRKSFCKLDCANKYAINYYAKNRDKLNQYQIDYHKKKRAEINKPQRAQAMKAWETRTNKGIGMGKKWTAEEVEFLKNNYKQKKHNEMCKTLGRSPEAVQKKCVFLGLRKNVKNEKRI